ncbi:MAG: Asp-tRNA(Asn)/Glu-tRNA(Gln) amidotransferase GatCAB subunit C [Planctomycetaceae bacterium]|jgi:aspartyl-tRNA(Asn)/glutamyl-tRNA(Gln) amidotransferase subunit C|nr:Asp-tRNA(Asn)/Glu-tRNA(Gln) amidotransferase GatCAB subunit C [Planctomycetaceae bacterium]
MSLSKSEIERVSLLARLRLSDAELTVMTEQLGQILEYVDQLNELDTEDVLPMAHAADLTNVFAKDEARPSLPREAALMNAPKSDDECYRVPAVLGD